MRFDLVRPCPKCPFRRDCIQGWLGERRATEIADGVLEDNNTFACHETTRHTEEGEYDQRGDEQHCVGARLLVEATGAPNQMLQIAERLELLDPSITAPNAADLVFDSKADFVNHHSNERRL